MVKREKNNGKNRKKTTPVAGSICVFPSYRSNRLRCSSASHGAAEPETRVGRPAVRKHPKRFGSSKRAEEFFVLSYYYQDFYNSITHHKNPSRYTVSLLLSELHEIINAGSQHDVGLVDRTCLKVSFFFCQMSASPFLFERCNTTTPAQ